MSLYSLARGTLKRTSVGMLCPSRRCFEDVLGEIDADADSGRDLPFCW